MGCDGIPGGWRPDRHRHALEVGGSNNLSHHNMVDDSQNNII